ncbi:WG repeat-containing protein [Clostridium disporicum]|uniref:KWG repeat-containing protein n=1 Tax=Clostridium disporicum TaxID=84024 RepID=A0A174B793_9CLOT|nr:WG repeat-containing protein [Clostridium disporicum]CUN96697.1 KWG repeat-containing protein [Clostridium disporicum]
MGSSDRYRLEKISKKKRIKAKKRRCSKQLYPALKNTKNGAIYGYINNKGEYVIEPKFEGAYDFNENCVAIVIKDNKYGVIDLLGEYKIYTIYDSISNFRESRAVYSKDGSMGIIDEDGNVITKKEYGIVGEFHDHRAVVGDSKSGNYKYGYIDREGKELIHLKFERADDFKDDIALVKVKDNEYSLIDKEGKVLNSYKHYLVSQYGDGLMMFSEKIDGPYGYIDIEGNEIITPRFTSTSEFVDGIAIVSVEENYNGPYGVINKKGEYVLTPIFSEIRYLGENRLALGMPIGKPLGDDKFIAPSIFAIGDTNGNILTQFKYYAVGNYDKGVTYASNNISTFFIDKNGKVINTLPKVKGSGELMIKDDIIYANIDYSPYYLTRSGKLIYKPNDEIILDYVYSVIKEKYKPNFSFLIYIPQIKGIKNRKVEKKVNSKLKTLSYFKPFAEDQISHSVNENDVLDYSYYGTFEVTFFKKNILILSLTGYYYPLGAAHGLSSKITPVINLDTGEFYSLEDLFNPNSDWKNRLDSIIQKMIDKEPQYEYVYKDGFKGIDEGQNFYIDDNNLYIYFQPYDIGPYAAGFIIFKIPFSLIQDIMVNKNIDINK